MADEKNSTRARDQSAAERNETFLRVYATHQRKIHAFVSTLVVNPADVDEVVQETSIILWRKFSEFRPDADFARWACGVAFHEVQRLRRVNRKSVLPLDMEVLESIATERMESSSRLDARHDALDECLSKLRREDRDLLNQCYSGDCTTQGVAKQIGRPVDAVYQSLYRIRKALQVCIERTIVAEERGQ